MEASTSNGPDDVKTFRGRSLEELLPQIRAELGPDAIVLRRREGLGGGVGGFFQRPYVEVDARAPQRRRAPAGDPHDRATVEGLSSPAVQALFEQATPFADALAAAARDTRTEEDTFSADVFQPRAPTPSRSARAALHARRPSRRVPAPPGSTARSRTPRAIARAVPAARARAGARARARAGARARARGRRARRSRPPRRSARPPASRSRARRRRRRRGAARRRRPEPRARRRRGRRGRRPRPAVLRRRAT